MQYTLLRWEGHPPPPPELGAARAFAVSRLVENLYQDFFHVDEVSMLTKRVD